MSPVRMLLSLTLGLCLVLMVFSSSLAQEARPLPVAPPPDAPEGQPEQPANEPDKEPTLTDKLGGEERYLTHLATDKPIYREGEKVYVRGTVLHAFTHAPIAQDDNNGRRQNFSPMVEIKDPKGAVVAGGQTQMQDSVFGFAWDVPKGQAGGQYTVKVTYPWSGLAPAERTFDIRAYRAPRIRSQIDFIKDGYGPGDTVIATIDATRAEGGIPEGAKVTAIARVDGAEVARVQTTFNTNGTAEARFDLPATIERGEGTLAFVIEDGGVVETASKTIPILLQTVDLQLFPEGGDLVAGVENRVYFEARTPYGKPADIKGVVVNGDGAEVASFETIHEGRGRFSFTPHSDERYTLRVTEPSSVTQVVEMPKPGIVGATICFDQSVYQHDDTVAFKVGLAKLAGVDRFTPSVDTVVFRQKESEVYRISRKDTEAVGDRQDPLAEQWDMQWSFEPEFEATGILTATAYDTKGNPLAERLIYRAPKEHVNIEILPNSAQYTPGGKVALTIKTTDSEGNPVSAVAGLTVTDDSVLEMIETREQAPALPAMVFLEPEVRELADAQVYLDPNNPDAAEQLDLLLGTQGWRRFALVNMEDFIREHGDDARRLFAFRVPVRAERERMVRRNAVQQDGAVDLFRAVPMAAPEAAAAGVGGGEAENAPVDDAPAPELAPVDPQAPPMPAQEKIAAGQDEKPQEQNEFQQALEEADRDQAGDALFADEEAGGRDAARRVMPQMVFVREYAHKQPGGKPFGQRSDFTETVYWSATTKTNEKGLATVEFDLSDSVTSFRVKADAFTAVGALGAGTGVIESVRPFYIEPKLPLELTAGDKVLLPIALVNNTDRELPVQLLISNLGKAGTTTLDPVALGADTRGRSLHELTIGETYGDLAFNIEARADALVDENRRSLRVVPRGFPVDQGSGGMLEPDSQKEGQFTIPETIVPGSLQASVTVYPTPMANLTEALEALIRDPHGCFEQTSSTTFPLVMAQQYFLTHQGIDPKLIAAAQEKLDAGYKRLIGFETQDKGYEWFGSTPPHEALTAYGLLEFVEMSKVMEVDQAMLDRTQDWLMSRCGNDGSFKLDSKALDSFGRAPQDTTDAYIVWSLLEAGYDPVKLATSIDLVLKKATEGDDAYIIALGANIAALSGNDEAEASLLAKLADKLTAEGYVDGAVTTITRSGGSSLNIETTSLAILAWLRDDSYTPQVEKSILWLTEQCKAGQFGSTQSTVLALKAIVEYDKARSTPKAPGELILLVDGEPVGEPVAFTEETKGAIKLPQIANLLTPGKHTIAVLMDGGSKMPYSIAVDYHAEKPVSSEECKLRIETSLNSDAGKIAEGETTEVNVKVSNITKDGLPTPIAIVGIPGGLEPSYDQLKELVKAGTIASFEVIGRDVVLYWREMKPEQVVELPIRCVAAVPGTYTGPASRAYLYYTNEHRQWADGLTVNITPRQGE